MLNTLKIVVLCQLSLLSGLNACIVPDAPAEGSYSIVGSEDAPIAGSTIEEFKILRYHCPAPNLLEGAPIIYCENGKWLPVIPKCVGNELCDLPAVPANGRITNSVDDVDQQLPGIQVRSLSVVEYSCDASYKLTGSDKITCYDGQWTSEPPKCRKI